MTPRLFYDIEGCGAAFGALPAIPGYVTSEEHDAAIAKLEAGRLLWIAGAATAGVALGAMLAVAIRADVGR